MLELPEGEVHLWEVRMSGMTADLESLRGFLSTVELQRVNAATVERARTQFIVSRGMLRRVLSRYCATEPGDLQLGIQGAGKPVLVHPAEPPLRFNVSHSGDLAIYGIARGRDVGIDVEHVRPVPRAMAIARRFLSQAEADALEELPAERVEREFLALWVKREAFAKAQATTVWRALEQLRSATLDSVASATPIAAGRSIHPSGWCVESLDYDQEHVAAIAARGTEWRVVRMGRATG